VVVCYGGVPVSQSVTSLCPARRLGRQLARPPLRFRLAGPLRLAQSAQAAVARRAPTTFQPGSLGFLLQLRVIRALPSIAKGPMIEEQPAGIVPTTDATTVPQ
jgi:hypothetical protein